MEHLKKQLETVTETAKLEIVNDTKKTLFAERLVPMISTLSSQINDSLDTFNQCDINSCHRKCGSVCNICSALLECLDDLRLPGVKPRWAAGLGVGVSSFDVRFRDAELAGPYSSDLRCKVHRSREDSGQNEAERTNAAIGDSVVDGGTIQWEKRKRFEGMTEDDIEQMTLDQYELYEKTRMEENFWYVTRELADRIDGAPVLGKYIKAFVSEQPTDMLFFSGRSYALVVYSSIRYGPSN